MSDAKKRTEFLIYELYGSISKYLQDGQLSRTVVLDDIDFIMHRIALNRSKTVGDAAKLLLVSKNQFISRLKKLGLYDCRMSELNCARISNTSTMPKITLPMANG